MRCVIDAHHHRRRRLPEHVNLPFCRRRDIYLTAATQHPEAPKRGKGAAATVSTGEKAATVC